MLFKNLTKKKQLELPTKSFTIDVKKLDSYSFDKLKDFIQKYERYIEKLSEEFYKLKESNDKLAEQNSQLEAQNKDLSDANVDLQNVLSLSEFKDSFFGMFRRTLRSLLVELGLPNNEEMTHSFGQFRDTMDSLHKESEVIKKRLSSEKFAKPDAQKELETNNEVVHNNLKGDRTCQDDDLTLQLNNNQNLVPNCLLSESKSFVKALDSLNDELNQKTKVIARASEGLENDIQRLMSSIEHMFVKLATPSESNILEKQRFEDLLLISKEKLSTTTKAIALLKKDLTKKTSELKTAEKSIAKLSKENSVLQANNSELDGNVQSLKKYLGSFAQSKNATDVDMPHHMELLKILQDENYKLNIALRDLKKPEVADGVDIQMLLEEKKKLEDKLADIDNKHIGALRQERLKLDNIKRDIEAYEEKCRDYELMMKAENTKYENLYKKYKELNQENYKNLKTMESLKRTNQMLENTGNGSQHNSSISNNGTTYKSAINMYHFNTELPRSPVKLKRRAEETERLLEEQEEMKIRVITAEVHLATERNIFSQILLEKNEEVKSLKEVML